MAAPSTDRLLLLPLSRSMLLARIATDEFRLRCATSEGPRRVRFEPPWPGEPAAYFPFMLEALPAGEESVEGTFALVRRTTWEAVGLAGTKGRPDAHGCVEIGYGISPSARGLGLATEGVGALVRHLLEDPDVRRVVAETTVGNLASMRVLERNGFERSWDAGAPGAPDSVRWHLERDGPVG